MWHGAVAGCSLKGGFNRRVRDRRLPESGHHRRVSHHHDAWSPASGLVTYNGNVREAMVAVQKNDQCPNFHDGRIEPLPRPMALARTVHSPTAYWSLWDREFRRDLALGQFGPRRSGGCRLRSRLAHDLGRAQTAGRMDDYLRLLSLPIQNSSDRPERLIGCRIEYWPRPSMLHAPAPQAASVSRPPTTATFFMNRSCWIIC